MHFAVPSSDRGLMGCINGGFGLPRSAASFNGRAEAEAERRSIIHVPANFASGSMICEKSSGSPDNRKKCPLVRPENPTNSSVPGQRWRPYCSP